MRAAIFHGTRDLRIEDFALRKLNSGEALIKIHACGVCGTDIHIYEGAKGSATVFPPIILGHELSGEICEVGDDVNDFKTGDRVCVDPNISCGKCSFCRRGQVHLCPRLDAIGVTLNGGFAEYCIAPEQQVYKLPDHLSFEQAALAEAIACCLHGVDLSGIKPGDQVLILGGGTIGLIMLQLVKHAGASQIILSEPVAKKRKLALTLGASLVLDPIQYNLHDFILCHTANGVDVAIECVGIKTTMAQALQATRRGGTIMLFGLAPPNCKIPVRPFDIFKRELTIKSSFINPFTQDRAIALLASGRVNVKDLIADIVPLNHILKIFNEENLRAKGKVIVKP